MAETIYTGYSAKERATMHELRTTLERLNSKGYPKVWGCYVNYLNQYLFTTDRNDLPKDYEWKSI